MLAELQSDLLLRLCSQCGAHQRGDRCAAVVNSCQFLPYRLILRAEERIELLVRAVSRSMLKQRLDISEREYGLENTDDNQPGEMHPSISFFSGSRNGSHFYIIVDHGGGQRLAVRSKIADHKGENLIHV